MARHLSTTASHTAATARHALKVADVEARGCSTLVIVIVPRARLGTTRGTSRNVADDFLAALNDIRATALACEYIIPASKTGEIDYEKVNLRFLTGTSANITIGNVNSAASCHPTKGGWYFDAAPPVGAPSKVLACPATCARFRGDPRGRVDLVVGCKTMPVE